MLAERRARGQQPEGDEQVLGGLQLGGRVLGVELGLEVLRSWASSMVTGSTAVVGWSPRIASTAARISA